MHKFILESEQRVGSRWVHYLLSDLLGMRPSPEIDGDKLIRQHMWAKEHIAQLFVENRIPKIHHVHYWDLRHALFPLFDYKVLGIVRNPRDRAVSVAFHHAWDTGKARWPQKDIVKHYDVFLHEAKTDEEREQIANDRDKELVRYTVMEYDRYFISNVRMLSNMRDTFSASAHHNYKSNYMWIPYESLKKSPATEFERVVAYLQATDLAMTVDEAIELHEFSNKAKRPVGEENRQDVWRRKGVVGDWTNWFTDEMIEATEGQYTLYNEYVKYAGYEVN